MIRGGGGGGMEEVLLLNSGRKRRSKCGWRKSMHMCINALYIVLYSVQDNRVCIVHS